MTLIKDNKTPNDLSQPEVFVSSSGSYHVKVIDILKSQKGKMLIKKMIVLNLVKKTSDK
jgi:hypothetical protein